MKPSDIFSLLQNDKSIIITKRHIKNEYKEFSESKSISLEDLDEWVEEITNNFIDSFNIVELKPVLTSFKKGILEDLNVCIKFEELEEGSKISSSEAIKQIPSLFENLNKISQYRDQVEYTLSYFTVIKKEFISFKKVIFDFYCRNILVKENIKQKKAIEASIESVTLDLSVYKSEIEGGISVLNSCIEVLDKKQSLLNKRESTIRLITKQEELDYFSNAKQSGNNYGFDE